MGGLAITAAMFDNKRIAVYQIYEIYARNNNQNMNLDYLYQVIIIGASLPVNTGHRYE